MGDLYRRLWNALLFLGRRPVFWVGIGLLAASYAAAGVSVIDALPWAIVWALIAAASRVLLAVLPRPAEGEGVLQEAGIPAAQLAVGVVPAFAPDSCPARDAMKSRLSPQLQRLMRS